MKKMCEGIKLNMIRILVENLGLRVYLLDYRSAK